MGVFTDKKFEELDWISQATEPIDSELNNCLSSLPDELTIDFNLYVDMVGDSWNISLSLDRILNYLLKKHYTNYHELTWKQKEELEKCFTLEMSDDNLKLNFVTSCIEGGTIKLLKHTTTFDEKVLKDLLGKKGIDHLHSYESAYNLKLSHANEVMEVLGKCDAGIRSKSARIKRATIVRRLQELFKNNEWNIKDTELADKVGLWISNYIFSGNLAAWANVCKLKVMTHKGQPIYSMEEVV